MMRALLVALALPLTLAACDTTVSPERAYADCSERARLAERPRGTVGLGVGSGGRAVSSFDVTVTGDFLSGRDPYVVYDQCFRRLTGAGPTRPLIL
ncbi:hypothetical protein [Roseicyclus mahoneyensis]|uniref:Lipoprotein n=1 Tax=Roseicyclus mahoneyensis TaxID=164332 RepID=A0A316GF61_9RHOB|nr:hypothetical protein [Roseicyclus mahoneyensis]PWK59322.1 hypothetical protein C7455_10890 [Roseicyclus mahoneyensis]